jgi:hypothetical protein
MGASIKHIDFSLLNLAFSDAKSCLTVHFSIIQKIRYLILKFHNPHILLTRKFKLSRIALFVKSESRLLSIFRQALI